MLEYLGVVRDVAQSGSALALGARCRRFESCHPDQLDLSAGIHHSGFSMRM